MGIFGVGGALGYIHFGLEKACPKPGYSEAVDSRGACVAGTAHGSPLTNRLVGPIRRILEREWLVRIQRYYREAYSCADWITRWSVQFPSGFQFFYLPPSGIRTLFIGDCVEAFILRLCTV
ncbi:hypothetical protein CRG98_036698 [Punica granatum]|uniref:Uncharacterized protein n=1 Tax=Punica granatum TaxID=22663 RepID=A0A2I0IGT1_PUNGR|nr:hypothetical protein CRG98_036698 [Punica granatum]